VQGVADVFKEIIMEIERHTGEPGGKAPAAKGDAAPARAPCRAAAPRPSSPSAPRDEGHKM
jgi:hypothetical protein